MTTVLERRAVPLALPDVGARVVLRQVGTARRAVVLGALYGDKLPIRPQILRGGRILTGVAAARRAVFIGRLR